MLGIDWLKEYGCVWDFKPGNLFFDGHLVSTTPAVHTSDADGCWPSHIKRYFRDLRKM